MPEAIRCPHCNLEVRVPETMLGQELRCPGCGTMFRAPTAAGTPAPEPLNVGAPLTSTPGPLPDEARTIMEAVPALGALPGQQPARPKEVGYIENMALFGGIWACVLPLFCCPVYISLYWLYVPLMCIPFELYSFVVGAMSIMTALNLRKPDGYLRPPPRINAFMQVANIINFDLPNAVMGGLTLYWLQEKPEVLRFYQGKDTSLLASVKPLEPPSPSPSASPAAAAPPPAASPPM